MTGWRVGFVAGNKDAIKALGTIKNNIDSGVFKAIQDAAIEAYKAPKSEIDRLNAMYRRKKRIMEKGLAELGWNVKPSKATFYLWLPCPDGFTSEEFATVMLEKAAIVFHRVTVTVNTVKDFQNCAYKTCGCSSKSAFKDERGRNFLQYEKREYVK